MLAVHGVKLLHNHGNRFNILTCHANNSLEHNCAEFSEDHGEKDCSLCEYKLAKDTDLFKIVFYQSPVFISEKNPDSRFSLITFFPPSAINKGPPAQA